MPQIADHLFILGLDSCESATELKAAYRGEINKWHPDRFHSNLAIQPTATERAKSINAAYEHLSELLEIGTLPRSTPCANTTQTSKSQQAYRTQHTYNRKSFTPGFPDPDVFEVFVKSSHIISTAYNRANGTLYIKFDGNVVYAYVHVPESVFSDFISADSHGKFAIATFIGSMSLPATNPRPARRRPLTGASRVRWTDSARVNAQSLDAIQGLSTFAQAPAGQDELVGFNNSLQVTPVGARRVVLSQKSGVPEIV